VGFKPQKRAVTGTLKLAFVADTKDIPDDFPLKTYVGGKVRKTKAIPVGTRAIFCWNPGCQWILITETWESREQITIVEKVVETVKQKLEKAASSSTYCIERIHKKKKS
jgi:hypothetical protein